MDPSIPFHNIPIQSFQNPCNLSYIAIPLIPNSTSDEKSNSIIQNTTHNHPLKKIEMIKDFEWINYLCEKKEINYVIDFLNNHDPSMIDFKSLDLQELEDVAIINVPKEFQSVAQDQYKRLLRFGGLDSNENIGVKSGALDKEHYNDKYNDFYDLNDPWINNEGDGEETQKNSKEKKDKKMAIPEVYYKDFYVNKGNLTDLLKASGYNERLKLLETFDELLEKSEKDTHMPEKRKRSEKEKKLIEKHTTKRKLQKKIKPNNNGVEFLNPYAMNNPFMLQENNFVMPNLKYNPFVYNKNPINQNSQMNNFPTGIINEQFLEKIKKEQQTLPPPYIDINDFSNLGVDFLNMMFQNNGNKLAINFPLANNAEFQIEPIQVENSINLEGIQEKNQCLEQEKNAKKKSKNLDFKAKHKNSFQNNENKNVYIEISENENSPQR